MRECIDDFIQLSLRLIRCEPNNGEVNTHLEYWSKISAVYWTIPGEHSMVGHLGWRGMKLVELVSVVKYGLVDDDVVGTLSIMNTEEIIEVAGNVVGDRLEWGL